jgi:mycoredoxin
MAKTVVMYSTTWCGDCRAARSFLEQNNIEYEEVHLEDSDEATELVMKVNHGKRSVPTLEIDGKYLNCSPFSPEKRRALAEALGIAH